MGGDPAAPGFGPILRFQPAPPPAPVDGVRVVVLDTTWSPPSDGPAGAVLGLRDVAARVLAERDAIADTSERLDEWAAASGVVDALTVEGTSFWYYVRLRHWMWLQEQLLWLGLVDDVVASTAPSAIETAAGCDEGLVAAARLLADRDGIPFRAAAGTDPAGTVPVGARRPATDPSAQRLGLVGRLVRRLRRPVAATTELASRRAAIQERLAALTPTADDPPRLLVVLEHAPQRVETPTGPRLMNAYLGPIVDRLRGSALDPIEIELRSRLADDATWERLMTPGSERTLPADILWTASTTDDRGDLDALAEAAAQAIETSGAPLTASGVDLGPSLTARVAGLARSTHAGHARSIARRRSVLRRLRPAAILLADEYHRQEWLTAARLEGIPSVAVQHGMIYRWHNGYMHRDRPAAMALADRTYVFGDWERRLLTGASVYRPDEVRVGGSPRLDLVGAQAVDREAVRTELGIGPDERMVVVSGTWGPIYRRFHYPVALAGLVDRPLPGIHVVVKLHPGEPDDGPYQAVIESAAAAAGHEPPRVTIVRSVDLYRLLGAADAHVGVQSTVLTEAVATGTRNLLADAFAGADLLGYVEAGVAAPVRDGGDLLAALAPDGPGLATPDARRAFLDDHFRPGSASERIAADLLAWPA